MTAPVTSGSSTSNTTTTPVNPKSALGKDEFLKLLVAQMKNQDPLNPQGGDQMAAQLAQFSSLEQLQNINASLDTQKTDNSTIIDSIQTSAAMGTIGKTIVASGDQFQFASGDDPAAKTVRATIPATAGKAMLKITDANGKVIGTRDLGEVHAGSLDIPLGEAGSALSPGVYHFAVSVTDVSGTTRAAPTSIVGKVDAVTATSTGPVLMSGGMTIPFSTVTEIRN
ncbi:MAG: flagellar hook capping protein [Gemmatimonadetes bacterium]|nr:flagellar hook capping protein [Gemmatimonadota bacterium]